MTLANAPIYASIPAKDIDRAKRWYEEKLGFTPAVDIGPGGFVYRTGGSNFVIYQTPFAGTGKHTIAGWPVDNIDAAMKELRGRGVVFEEYAMGEQGPTTENGVARDPAGGAAAWFKDSEDNILVINELPPGMSFGG